MVGQSVKILAPQKSLTDILGLKAEYGCPNITEESWETVQETRYLAFL